MPSGGKEVEIKLRVASRARFLRAIRKLGARVLPSRVAGKGGRVHEWNVLYDTRDQSLARHGQLIRLRIESPSRGAAPKGKTRILLTYKGPVEGTSRAPGGSGQRYKVRQEIELELADGKGMARIFAALGLAEGFRYEKFRTTFAFPPGIRWAAGLLIELDETPLGLFAELEGPPKAIDRAALALGYTHKNYITCSYLDLHLAACTGKGSVVAGPQSGLPPRIPDMVFRSR